jgi:cellulose synthase/poly-beta-1,6-N-acetylglucosamine synthase-like glycosyltransferase
MRKLVIVASACPDRTNSELRRLERRDRRVQVVLEDKRYGKAEAINRVLEVSNTPIVLLVNSDARPSKGAIPALITDILSDSSIGAVSAVPEPERRGGLVSLLLNFMWEAHNGCSLTLNHMNISNHSCDELVAFRSSAIARLPKNLVNDGAFMAGVAKQKGYSIRVSPGATVHIQTPSRITDVVSQRRRILFGHAQVWRLVGSPPRTIETLLFISPIKGMRLLVRTLAAEPRYLMALPIAMVSELSAAIMSIVDSAKSSKAHTVWRRFT